MADSPRIISADGTSVVGAAVVPQDLSPLEVDDPFLTFIRVDHQTRLQFGATEVCIGAPFSLTLGQARHELDPGTRTELGPLLGIYPNVLEAAHVDDSCALHLRFESGATLSVPPDSNYEAWEIHGPGTRLVVCQPGGKELAIWR